MPEGTDTGFRGSLERFWTDDVFAPHLDGARIDVSGVTSEIEGCSDAVLAFERAVEAQAQWLTPLVEEDAQAPITGDLQTTDGREIRFPLTGAVWEIAKPSEELLPARRRLVFDETASQFDLISPIQFDLLESSRQTETVEGIWQARPIVATLVVTYSPSGCRGLSVSREPLVHRFPLALMASEP